MSHIAGWTAERRRYAPALTRWENSRHDFDRANELLAGRDAALLMRETEKAIDLHWLKVEAVAKALLTRETLSGRDIERVVRAGTVHCRWRELQ